jgi:hypothetical protein
MKSLTPLNEKRFGWHSDQPAVSAGKPTNQPTNQPTIQLIVEKN